MYLSVKYLLLMDNSLYYTEVFVLLIDSKGNGVKNRKWENFEFIDGNALTVKTKIKISHPYVSCW